MLLLRSNLKQLRLPTIGREFEKLAREAASSNQTFEQYLLRLTELEVTTRQSNALQARIKQANLPVEKDLDSFDCSAIPSLNKQKISQRRQASHIGFLSQVNRSGSSYQTATGGWNWHAANGFPNTRMSACSGNRERGTGKTHIAISLAAAACRQGHTVRFFTAATLVNLLEEKQKAYLLDRYLTQLDRTDLLIVDELGYLSFSRGGAELLFQVFADRYERRSLLLTSNLAFSDWGQIFQGERMTAALLDRLTHHCEIFEMNSESFRFRESMKEQKKTRKQT